VLTDARALTGDALLIEQSLHLREGIGVDQRFMAALELLLVGRAALVRQLADVVAPT
jgi:hypothetical protein